MYRGGIILKTSEQIEQMAAAGAVQARCLKMLRAKIRPGVTTEELDALAHEEYVKRGAYPSPLNYHGYPKSICTSVNEVICHGIPDDRALKEGDIFSADLGLILDGWHADSAYTYAVGEITEETEKLLEVTQAALEAGIEKCWPGNRIGDIGHAIQTVVEQAGFRVVRQLVGHGIGKSLHEDPPVPNYGRPGRGPILEEGMVLAIEPMVNAGGFETRLLDDGWGIVTADGSLSAHFEHTVAVTAEGPQVLTRL